MVRNWSCFGQSSVKTLRRSERKVASLANQEDTKMTDRNTTTRFTTISLAAAMIIGFFASVSAAADNHFTRYADELNRCVEAARDNTIEPTTQQIRHFVTEESAAGVWARFEIRTELYDDVDGPMVKAVQSQCRAHRWDDRLVLDQ